MASRVPRDSSKKLTVLRAEEFGEVGVELLRSHAYVIDCSVNLEPEELRDMVALCEDLSGNSERRWARKSFGRPTGGSSLVVGSYGGSVVGRKMKLGVFTQKERVTEKGRSEKSDMWCASGKKTILPSKLWTSLHPFVAASSASNDSQYLADTVLPDASRRS
ncbi:hypothetical protein NL676_038935 [Syzygium grande]|nr:hypothetical protein NL676_038935 [Syzygium grande]